MATNDLCPVRGYERSGITAPDGRRGGAVVDCPRCGFFRVSRRAMHRLREDVPRARLSAWIRQHREFGKAPPAIAEHDFDRILASLSEYSVADKLLLALRAIERRTNTPGHAAPLTPDKDLPVAWVGDEQELQFVLVALRDHGLIELDGSEGAATCTITSDGWAFLRKRGTNPTKIMTTICSVSVQCGTNRQNMVHHYNTIRY